MKKLALVLCVMLLASVAHAAPFAPVPMVIDAADQVTYLFDHTSVDITFNLTGKSGTVYLVINTKYADAQKPVSVQNGFKGWHYVNKIDTTVYVSSSSKFSTGTGLKITWNGKGNERSPQTYTEGEYVPAGTYQYYLFGYDSESSRVNACTYISIGQYWESQYARIYEKDTSGNKLDRPWIMGSLWNNVVPNIGGSTTFPIYTPRIWKGVHLKWELGNDPTLDALLQTSACPGYDQSANATNQLYGSGVFNPKDWNTFYFVSHVSGEKKAMPTKWTFVPDGNAIMDTDWNDWDKLVWFHPGTKPDAQRDVMLSDADDQYLWVISGGQNPHPFQWDKLRAMDYEDATVLFDMYNEDFYMPEQPDYGGATRTTSETNRAFNRFGKDFAITGDWSCLMELIDGNRLLADSATKSGTWWTPSRGGDGYVLWGNSNGDYFLDNSSAADAPAPWACIVSDPRTPDNARRYIGGIDSNGFLISYLCFAGLYAMGVQTQDGSGVDYLAFADDSFASGSGNTNKRDTGTICDNESIYDGLYMGAAMTGASGTDYTTNKYAGCYWMAYDSDKGILTDGVAVDEAAPAAFTVAQNSPNPFNPKTTLTYTLAKEGRVTVDVYNVAGQKVDTLVNDIQSAGSHSVVWDAANRAAGVYFYTVKSGNFSKTMKMTLLK